MIATTPMHLTCIRIATLLECQAEWERANHRSIYVWEPLDADDIPANARARPCMLNEVHFWSADGNEKLREVRHHDLMQASPTLVRVRGTGRWWEIASGSVLWRDGRWYMRWLAYDNGRASRDINGEIAGDLGIRPRVRWRLAWWFRRLPQRWANRIHDWRRGLVRWWGPAWPAYLVAIVIGGIGLGLLAFAVLRWRG